jgi:hypothetical protein
VTKSARHMPYKRPMFVKMFDLVRCREFESAVLGCNSQEVHKLVAMPICISCLRESVLELEVPRFSRPASGT